MNSISSMKEALENDGLEQPDTKSASDSATDSLLKLMNREDCTSADKMIVCTTVDDSKNHTRCKNNCYVLIHMTFSIVIHKKIFS